MSDSILDSCYEKLIEVIEVAIARSKNSSDLAEEADAKARAAKKKMEEIKKLAGLNPKDKESFIEEYKVERKRAEAEEARCVSFWHFSALHRENALGAYAFWLATSPGEFVKKHQEDVLNMVYQ